MAVDYKKLLEDITKYESSNPDIMSRDITSVISGSIGDPKEPTKIDYVEKTYQPSSEIPQDYTTSLKRLREAQAKLTPELLKKFPDAKVIYEKAVKENTADRYKTLKTIKDSYQLNQEEMSKILGVEGYEMYKKDLSTVSEQLNKNYPGLADISGTNESVGNVPLYGVRSALLTQYSGAPRTSEDVKKDVVDYTKLFNMDKEGL